MKNFTEVIQGCINKIDKYQRMLYEHYRGYALQIVFRYIYDYDEARHAVNDGFVKLLNNINRYESKEHVDDEKLFMGWLKKIMINVSIDHLRRDKRGETDYLSETDSCLPDKDFNTDETLFYNDLIKLLRDLPPAYCTVFNLHVIDGYSYVEIAEMLSIPVGTSRSNLLRARTLLQNNIIKLEQKQVCRT